MYDPNALDNLVGHPVNVWMTDGTKCISAVLEAVIRDANNAPTAIVIVGIIFVTDMADSGMKIQLAASEMVIPWSAVFAMARAPGK